MAGSWAELLAWSRQTWVCGTRLTIEWWHRRVTLYARVRPPAVSGTGFVLTVSLAAQAHKQKQLLHTEEGDRRDDAAEGFGCCPVYPCSTFFGGRLPTSAAFASNISHRPVEKASLDQGPPFFNNA
jgi:hypothetical protein